MLQEINGRKEGIDMKRTIIPIIMLSSLALYAGVALGQDLIIFPAKGQSNEQMERDKYDCYQWAK